eukprot:SAG11_NODE_17_length_26125_cov_45.892723_11_plen_298_part_00
MCERVTYARNTDGVRKPTPPAGRSRGPSNVPRAGRRRAARPWDLPDDSLGGDGGVRRQSRAPKSAHQHSARGPARGKQPKHLHDAFEADVEGGLDELSRLRMQINQIDDHTGANDGFSVEVVHTAASTTAGRNSAQRQCGQRGRRSAAEGAQTARRPKPWTAQGDLRLAEGHGLHCDDWGAVARYVGSHWTAAECRVRWREIREGSCLNSLRRAIHGRDPRQLEQALLAARERGMAGEELEEAEQMLVELRVWEREQARERAAARHARRRQVDHDIHELLESAKLKLRALSYSLYGE